MLHGHRASGRSFVAKAVIAVMAITLLAASCGGKKLNSKGSNGGNASPELSTKTESGLADAGKPVRGGKLIYGLEAETGGGFCLAEGQLAIAGIMVARAFYDTLTMPNDKGQYVPYLAKSVSHDPTYKTWTINLRSGIKFSDGSALTATVVKNNIDAFRGKYPGRSSLLFVFVLNNITSVTATGPLTVQVKTAKPWVAFPAYLYSSGRLGIMGQAQLDDAKTCDRKLIGTGPFIFDSWKVGSSLKGHANTNYWQIAPDGKPYPYVDSVDFRPIPEGTQRVNALQSGSVNVMHTSNPEDIGGPLAKLRDDGKINAYVTQKFGEVAYTMLNTSKPPFDDIRMREALAMGADRNEINDIANNGLPQVIDGPFAPGNVGYLKDPGFPKFDLEKAKSLVKAYVAEGKGHKAQFTINASNDPSVVRLAELIQERATKVGVAVKIKQEEQAQLINDAIGGSFQATTWRNHPGGDPDDQYVWWYDGNPSPKVTTNPVNFGRINDPVIDKLLNQGRSEPDPAKRKTIYEDLNREFAKKVWDVWGWVTPWAVVENKNVHGILGPPLPDGSQPNPGLAVGHRLIGMWISKN
jgi:peptide/nickel transport system substrate-binding protein